MIPPAILPDLSRQDYLDAVKRADTPAELKARVLLCREMGFIDDCETVEWIAMAGVADA